VQRTVIDTASWSHFEINGLSVAPSLAGAVHTFSFRNKPVEIRLPRAPKRESKSHGLWGNDRIQCTSWHGVSGRPLCFEISSVDVFVDLKRTLKVPLEALGHVDRDLFRAREKRGFERLVKAGDILAIGALERWIRVLRWKSLRPYLGRPQISSGPRHGTYLLESAGKQRFWVGTISLTLSISSPLSKRLWRRAGVALTEGAEPPIWFDFLLDGEHRIASGDLSGGVIDLAIAAESLLREVLAEKHSRRPVTTEFRSLLNQLPIGRIIDRWKDLGFRSRAWTQAMDVKTLSDCLNFVIALCTGLTIGLKSLSARSWRELLVGLLSMPLAASRARSRMQRAAIIPGEEAWHDFGKRGKLVAL